VDISNLNYTAKAEAGVFLQFRHPTTGEPMADGDTAIGAMVKPLYAKSVMDGLRAREKAAMISDDDIGIRARVVADAAVCTAGLVGITDNGEAVTDYAAFYDMTFVTPSQDAPGGFAFQVTKRAMEYGDFLTDA
jgi:hypothetical protein